MMKNTLNGAASSLTEDMDFLIRDARLLLMEQIGKRVGRLGIPLRIWFPLRVLFRNEGITQRELGRMLGFGDAHAGVIVRMMQRKHLVLRRASTVDKRRIDLFLTPEGKRTARQALRHMNAIHATIVAGFSASEADAFRRLLRRAHDNLASS